MIDSRIPRRKRRAETEVLIPAGPKIAFTGGLDFNDHHAVWDRLRQVHAKHPDMVRSMGAARGALSESQPAGQHSPSPQIAFSPTGRVTPKPPVQAATTRSSAVLPIGVIVFPGSGSRPPPPIRRRSSDIRFGSPARHMTRPYFTERAARDFQPVPHLLWSLGAKVVVRASSNDFIVRRMPMTIAIS